jgi:hypothetical protein
MFLIHSAKNLLVNTHHFPNLDPRLKIIQHLKTSIIIRRRHDTQPNDTQPNDTQHNDIQPNNTQNNDTQHKGRISDIEHNDTIMTLSTKGL